jgi:hypothetical protein
MGCLPDHPRSLLPQNGGKQIGMQQLIIDKNRIQIGQHAILKSISPYPTILIAD